MFLAVIETDRYKEPIDARGKFWMQARECISQVLEGPGRRMRWGLPDGTREEITGDLDKKQGAMVYVLDVSFYKGTMKML